MHEIVSREKELLNLLLSELNEIKDFIMGIEPVDCCEEQKEGCLLDTMYKNIKNLEKATTITKKIKESIKGE